MPKTYEEYLLLKKLQTGNKAEIKNEDIVQSYSWVNGISYRGPVFDVLECNESKVSSKGEILNTRFVWVTNLLVSKNNLSKMPEEED